MRGDPTTVVRDLFRATHAGLQSEAGLRRVLDCFTDDAVWHNLPLDPVRGKARIANALRSFAPSWGQIEIEVKNIAAVGNVVLTERVDTHTGGGNTVAIPVCGVFEIRDDKIAAWREYFDMRTVAERLALISTHTGS